MDFRPPLIANAQPEELVKPGYRTLHYPTVDAQPPAMASQTARTGSIPRERSIRR